MVRFVVRIGIIKSIFVLLSIWMVEEEYRLKWHNHTVHLRKGSSDFDIYRQVLVFDSYKVKGADKNSIQTVVDLGANIGLSTLYFKEKFPGAKIISVEPDRGNFNLMVRNTKDLSNVFCLNQAIWPYDTELTLYDSGKGEDSYTVGEIRNGNENKVQGITVSDIIRDFKLPSIDILKIDIEGAEKELFSSNYMNWLPKVHIIIIELHDWMRDGCACSFFRAISSFDYTMSGNGENITIVLSHPEIPVEEKILAHLEV